MNAKTVATILVLVSLGLAAGLIYRHRTALDEKKQDIETINTFSNQWVLATNKLEEQRMVTLTLEADLVKKDEELKVYSNNLAQVTATLSKTESEAKAAAAAAQSELAKRDARITELETERDDLTKRMAGLNLSIKDLEGQIAATQKKLDASEGDREFLYGELKRLRAEKAELERQFNDLAMLREQVRKLRDELSIARRLEWIRRGLYGNLLKGGERLQLGFRPRPPTTNYDLKVEIRREGGARIVSPGATNLPPARTNAPVQR